ncbi:MAG: RNA polymerase sigma factor [Myxococcota bacterium]|nr:RNA polymerase sigma factor [Myxococcota bacterium]
MPVHRPIRARPASVVAPRAPRPRELGGGAIPQVAPEHAPDDAELVARASRGDQWAQEAIFRRYVQDVTRVAQRLLRRRDDADDVVQDTFASALTSLDALRDPALLRSWLLGIAVHRVRRRHRRQAFLRMLGLDRGLDDASLAMVAAHDLTPEMAAELALVDGALSTLGADERFAWMLRYVEGEKLEDVAAVLDVSLATAKRRIAVADARIRAHVAGVRR